MTWQFFNPATCELAGRSYAGPEAALAMNTPAGMQAVLVPELLDPRRHVVRLVVGDFGDQHAFVIERTPDKPADTELVAWQWHDGLADWIPTPTLLAEIQKVQTSVLAQLQWLDAKMARPLGEIALAQALGAAAPAAAVDRLALIEADKATLRAYLGQLAAANSSEALAALVAAAPLLQTITN